jgi:beta-lactamase superfamily II metal-dependent hydrolase
MAMAAAIREFKPRGFLASNSSHTTPRYLALLELVRDQGIRAIGPKDRPRRIELGSVVLTVFPQAQEDRSEENNNSIGIRLQHGAFSALLPGDAEQAKTPLVGADHPRSLRLLHGSQAGAPRRGALCS